MIIKDKGVFVKLYQNITKAKKRNNCKKFKRTIISGCLQATSKHKAIIETKNYSGRIRDGNSLILETRNTASLFISYISFLLISTALFFYFVL